MLNGLAITPPVIGRIAIGKLVERGGKRLPEKDDGFTLTSQVQGKSGWIAHPLDQVLRKQSMSSGSGSGTEKLRSIPVRMLFNDPNLNFRVSYSLFDRASGRPVCVGNGLVCRRLTAKGVEQMPCPAPEGCDIGHGYCKPYGRLNVHVDMKDMKDVKAGEDGAGLHDEDELGSFVFRTTGFNSIRTVSARLRYLQALSGDILASLPLCLRLRGKSSSNQYRSTLYYVDLTTRPGEGLTDAMARGRELDGQRKQAGLHQAALDEAARAALALGAFEEDPDEGLDAVQEFYPELEGSGEDTRTGNRTDAQPKVGVAAKLAQQRQRLPGQMQSSQTPQATP